MSLIDVNVVLGPRPADDAPELTVPALLAELDRYGIGTALVRHADAVFYDAEVGNAVLIDQVCAEPRLLPAFVVGPLDAGEHGGPDGFRAHLDRNAVSAVWLYPQRHGWSVRGPEAGTLLRALATSRRPLFVELGECDWADVAHLARALPDNDIVVCDVGYRTLRQAFAVLNDHPRVRLDTSLLAGHSAVELIAARFGADRLCFGSGTPTRDLAGARYRLALSDLDQIPRRAVEAGTAAQLLDVRPPGAPLWSPAAPVTGIVDVHTHVGRWPSSYTPAATAQDLIASMDRTGTVLSIVSAMRALWSGEVRSGNDEALEAARRYPGRLYMHLVANPHRPADRGYLADLAVCQEVRGVKVHPHTHECALDDERYDWIFDLAVEHHLPVLGHSYGGTWHSDPARFATVAARRPELTLVAGHAGAHPSGFRTMIDAAEYPNLYAEICGSFMTGWWLRQLVDAFGAGRVLHGTDATLIDPRFGVGRVLGADLKDEERSLVLGGNARRLYDGPGN